VLTSERYLISLAADEDGIWRRVDGGVLELAMYNCFDVSVELSPLPVALTLRRIALAPREAAIVNVASVDIPTLEVRLIEHRYTCLSIDADHSDYRFENFDSGARSLIRIDSDGVVASLEGTFARVWPIG
jgi:hypothetical protein